MFLIIALICGSITDMTYVSADNKKISDILYTIDGITKSATYNHNNDTFSCDDNKEICNTIEFFPKNTHNEFTKILQIIEQ